MDLKNLNLASWIFFNTRTVMFMIHNRFCLNFTNMWIELDFFSSSISVQRPLHEFQPFYCTKPPKKSIISFITTPSRDIRSLNMCQAFWQPWPTATRLSTFSAVPSTPTVIDNVQSRLDIELDAILGGPPCKRRRMSSEANVPVGSSLFSRAFFL